MIIISSGPDTYRAREKARELVGAFREKHDPEGLSIDVIDGDAGLPALLSRIGSASLFAKKKMVRADGCLAKMKLADARILAARLADDADATVLLTVETEPPDRKTLDALKKAPCFHYPFELESGSRFRSRVRVIAASFGVSDAKADVISDYADGDTWYAVTELAKQSANPSDVGARAVPDTYSMYDVAEEYLRVHGAWRKRAMESGVEGMLNVFLSQSRASIRVRDGSTDGLHPYVVKKLQRANTDSSARRLAQAITALVSNRSSISIGTEWEAIIT